VARWLADLKLTPVDGVDRTGAPLTEVTEAIRVERRLQSAPRQVRIDSVQPLDKDEGLWTLRLSTERRGRRIDWRGASLVAGLLQDGLPFRAEVIECDGRRATAHVPAPEVPTPGLVELVPFDYLAAPARLARSPALRAVRPRYERLLEAAAGWRVDAAADSAWGASWGIVWGPPGTGKTHTLVDEVARLVQRDDERILVLSTTNRATDEIAIRLSPHAPGRVTRFGRPDLARFIDAGALDAFPGGGGLLSAIAEAEAQLDVATTPAERAIALRAVARQRGRLPRMKDIVARMEPRCAVTTLHAALSTVVDERCVELLSQGYAPFTTVVVDEAGLVPRATAAAIALLSARRVVLVGDPRQLSPICVASRSLEPRVKRWLAVSALEHARSDDSNVQTLTVQYRMHPEIRAVVSALSYQGGLQDADTVKARRWPEGARLARLPRAVWLVLDKFAGDGSAAAERSSEGSWFRERGRDAFRALLEGYGEFRDADGLFISPYREQARRARLTAERFGGRQWSCSTVHAQQGAQAEIVFFDLVRGTGWPPPEFRRLVNVGLSRARELLVFCATEAEMGASWLAPAADLFARFVIENGELVRLEDDRQESLFTRPPSKTTTNLPVDSGGDASLLSRVDADPARLGIQIAHRRAARRTLTRAQELLVGRSLKDLGPRLVRGVAGSGKTVVLARWAAAELVTYPLRTATVLFGNHALQPHLERLLRRAWAVTTDGRPYPEERVRLRHVGAFLRDLLRERGLRPPEQPWDWSACVAQLGSQPIAGPRFDLLYIDEAQDLGHDVLEFVLRLVDRRAGFPVRIFYDNAQNVYERRAPTWSAYGLDVRGRSTVLRESFRTTRPAMELALNILDALRPLKRDADLRELMRTPSERPSLVQGDDGWWRAHFCVPAGQPPVVRVHSTRDEELAELVVAVRAWIDDHVAPRDVRILALGDDLRDQLVRRLRAANVPAVERRGRDFDPREDAVVVTTPQSFKGYEAEVVAVAGLDLFGLPRRGVLAEVLYVALTRAQTILHVSATRAAHDEPAQRIVEALERAAQLQLRQSASV